MELEPYATTDQLAAFWGVELTTAQLTRANALLPLASNRLRQMATNDGIDLDAEVVASPVFASNVQWVVMEAVKRALMTPTDTPPVDTYQQTAGPYSENYKFSNPSGDLWFRKNELAAIGLYGNQSLSSISTTPRDIYSS